MEGGKGKTDREREEKIVPRFSRDEGMAVFWLADLFCFAMGY